MPTLLYCREGEVLAQIDPATFEKDIEAIRGIPGRAYDCAKKSWVLPLNSAKDILETAKKCGWNVDTYVDFLLLEKMNAGEKLRELSACKESAKIPFAPIVSVLRPFQKSGVAYALATKCCLIADDMGLGKTLQAIATVELSNSYPVVVICPATLKFNWEREFKKWLGSTRRVVVLSGRARNSADFAGADVVIANYEIVAVTEKKVVKSDITGARPRTVEYYPVAQYIAQEFLPRAVVFDESHYLKNQKSKRSQACIELASTAEYCLALTGTPVLNRPVELVAQLKAIRTFDKVFGTYSAFVARYCGAQRVSRRFYGRVRSWFDVSGSSNLEELNEKLRASCMVRRMKTEVLTELPEKQRTVIPFCLSDKHKAEYLHAEADLISYLGLMNFEDIARVASAEGLLKLEVLKQIAARGKMSAVIQWVEDFLESGEKLLLFGTHTEFIEQVHAYFGHIVCRKITGSDSQEERKISEEYFQDKSSPVKLLVCNIKAAGVGLTLTAASNVAFFELGWTPADHDQAEDRCHRIGQNNPVTAWYLVAAETIEEAIIDLIDSKRAVVDSAANGRVCSDINSPAAELLKTLLKRSKKNGLAI